VGGHCCFCLLTNSPTAEIARLPAAGTAALSLQLLLLPLLPLLLWLLLLLLRVL